MPPASLPAVPLAPFPSPIQELPRLRAALGGGPRLLVKRDDAIAFAFGGNKVRKLALVAADALAGGADTLVTCGGIQSNHARVTACTAARLGLRCVLVVNGERPSRLTGNALLDALAGADVRYVSRRDDRAAAMDEAAGEVRRKGGRPYVIPLGASTPLGAAAFVDALTEMLAQIAAPDVIVHASSSGGTQAGLVAGCALAGVATRVIGISADDPAPALKDQVRLLISGLPPLLDVTSESLASARIEVDDGWVGGGYGVPTAESTDAIDLVARSEGLFLDPTYTAKAMAALIGRVRSRQFDDHQTVLFWHTGGQPALFA
jgi:D-cysteine desulfhydrase family pyridoxal phosphate-dependent enzyme